jgi:DNA-binding XRE family transcriptional regulator
MSDNIKIAKVKSDYDPDCVLTIIKNNDGDIILDINKRMQADGTGEFRITMSGGQFSGRSKVAIVGFFERLIDAFNKENEINKSREQLKKLDIRGSIYKEIGSRIKMYRKMRHLTQQGLAEKIGVSRFAVIMYENGKECAPIERLYTIADVLGIMVLELLPH